MALSKQHKVYGVILGLAAAAFAADRFAFGGGGAESAEASAEKPGTNAAARGGRSAAARSNGSAIPAATATATAEPRNDLADRFRAYAASNGLNERPVRDAFTPDASWVATTAAETQPASAASDPAREFLGAHRLTAVMTGEGGAARAAVIDGKAVRVGQTVGGFKLVAVTDRGATLRRGTHTARMTLPQANAAADR